ncbi:MAG TPA: hypothetical protein VED37_13875, partial [Ktedonobacteraceae bacterium]|nr:hypothetical protein [Ktedonobacteraceae bacterium]
MHTKLTNTKKQYPETNNISSETLGNEGLQPPQPFQGQPDQQQPYYAWQYDQNQPEPLGQQQPPPAMPTQIDYAQQPQYPMNDQQAPAISPQMPHQYKQPVQD